MSNYPEEMVSPMRAELVEAGFTSLHTAEDVDQALGRPGLTLLVVNSVCGCAAAAARPGVREAMARGLRFDQCVTVFAGMEKEAVLRVREYFEGAAPTSPQVAVLKDGHLQWLMQRGDFLGRSADEIAEHITRSYQAGFAS